MNTNPRASLRLHACLCLLSLLLPLGRASAQPQSDDPRFRTFFVTRAIEHEQFLPYLKAARPGIVQVGNYGAEFHGNADNPRATGSPMMLPVVGEHEALAFQRRINEQVHELGLTVVGLFRLVKVPGNWEEQTGFVDYYNHRWSEDLLGPRPHDDLRNMLQRDADGTPIQLKTELPFCLSSPYTRQMFKQMLKLAIDHGVDGVITTYNYYFGCACPDCQASFKDWLSTHLTPERIKKELGIKDLAHHTFQTIPARIPGYPDVETATDLDFWAMRWAAEHFKEMYDEIFLEYGRSLDPDLIVAQWDHLGHVRPTEERSFLPLELWGRGETYFWYSGGAAFVGKNHNLAEGKAGDAWLSHLYIRALAQGKPFVMGKYDRTRMAASMAEGYATGAMGMGRYMQFDQPAGFDVLVRYTNFRHDRHDLYDKAVPLADAALLLPRQSVQHRHPEAQRIFGELGQALVERQTLIDVAVDQRLSPDCLAQYPAVILVEALALSDDQLTMLRDYAAEGGAVFVWGPFGTLDEDGRPRPGGVKIPGAVTVSAEEAEDAATAIASFLEHDGSSVIRAPWTVRAAAYTKPGSIILHLVNYDREEGAPNDNRTGAETERPRAVENIPINLSLPPNKEATKVTLHTPESNEPRALPFDSTKGRVKFTLPHLLVYSVITIDTE